MTNKNKHKYMLILVDWETNGQITAQFNDLNSIDQIPEHLVKQLKIYNEKKGKPSTDIDVDEVVRRHLELKE